MKKMQLTQKSLLYFNFFVFIMMLLHNSTCFFKEASFDKMHSRANDL